MKNAFNYSPTSYKLPELPKLQSATPVPQSPVTKNTYAQSILETLGKGIKAPTAFTQGTNINDQLMPYQQLGQEFVQQNYLPEYLQDTYNPQVQDFANNAATGNLALVGNGQDTINRFRGNLQRDFQNQAQSILDMFSNSGYQKTGQNISDYYTGQFNF